MIPRKCLVRGGRVQNLISSEKEKKMHHESLNLVSQKKNITFHFDLANYDLMCMEIHVHNISACRIIFKSLKRERETTHVYIIQGG